MHSSGMTDTSFPRIPFGGEERTHGRRESQNIRRRRDIGILARRQTQDDGSAELTAHRMAFCGAASARAADGLIVLPLFRRRRTGEL